VPAINSSKFPSRNLLFAVAVFAASASLCHGQMYRPSPGTPKPPTVGFGVLDYQGNPYNRLTNPAFFPSYHYANPRFAPNQYPYGAPLSTYNFNSLYAPNVSQPRYFGSPLQQNGFPPQGFGNGFPPQGGQNPFADQFGNQPLLRDLNQPNFAQPNLARPPLNPKGIDLLKGN
jgi:hypothetical protein